MARALRWRVFRPPTAQGRPGRCKRPVIVESIPGCRGSEVGSVSAARPASSKEALASSDRTPLQPSCPPHSASTDARRRLSGASDVADSPRERRRSGTDTRSSKHTAHVWPREEEARPLRDRPPHCGVDDEDDRILVPRSADGLTFESRPSIRPSLSQSVEQHSSPDLRRPSHCAQSVHPCAAECADSYASRPIS